MLLSFRFANHKSFRDEQQLNLTPVYADDAPVEEQFAVLPVTGVFGANASGKSNLIDALSYVGSFVRRSDREVEPDVGIKSLRIGRQPFLLEPEIATQPSSYVIDLMIEGVRCTYGFVLDDERILQEWLYVYPRHRRRRVFQRTLDEFLWGEESAKSELREVAGIVAPTALFLSATARFARPRSGAEEGSDETQEILHSVYSALSSITRGSDVGRSPMPASYLATWLAEPTRRSVVTELLRSADIGLRDVLITSPKPEQDGEEGIFGDLGAEMTPRARSAPRIRFLHNGASDVAFGLSDESRGTVQLLRLAQSALTVLERGRVLVVDEIDASLHPLLTAKLIGMFHSEAANPLRAQLIFTSHDATLLGTLDGEEVLRRDEVWFTEKDSEGASTLYPLAEFKPRRDENRQRRYLNGSYGGIPNVSMRMFEEALATRGSGEGDG